MHQPSFRTIRPVEKQPYFIQTIDSVESNLELDKPNASAYIRIVNLNPISEAARLLGSQRSDRKAKTSAENGKKGGRPKLKKAKKKTRSA